MNWVGGVRSRIKYKWQHEKKQQREFFERKKHENKVQKAGYTKKSPNRKLGISQDLVSLQTIKSTHGADRPTEPRNVKKVDLDKFKSGFRRDENLDLPMSPCKHPSKLDLMDATESQKLSPAKLNFDKWNSHRPVVSKAMDEFKTPLSQMLPLTHKWPDTSSAVLREDTENSSQKAFLPYSKPGPKVTFASTHKQGGWSEQDESQWKQQPWWAKASNTSPQHSHPNPYHNSSMLRTDCQCQDNVTPKDFGIPHKRIELNQFHISEDFQPTPLEKYMTKTKRLEHGTLNKRKSSGFAHKHQEIHGKSDAWQRFVDDAISFSKMNKRSTPSPQFKSNGPSYTGPSQNRMPPWETPAPVYGETPAARKRRKIYGGEGHVVYQEQSSGSGIALPISTPEPALPIYLSARESSWDTDEEYAGFKRNFRRKIERRDTNKAVGLDLPSPISLNLPSPIRSSTPKSSTQVRPMTPQDTLTFDDDTFIALDIDEPSYKSGLTALMAGHINKLSAQKKQKNSSHMGIKHSDFDLRTEAEMGEEKEGKSRKNEEIKSETMLLDISDETLKVQLAEVDNCMQGTPSRGPCTNQTKSAVAQALEQLLGLDRISDKMESLEVDQELKGDPLRPNEAIMAMDNHINTTTSLEKIPLEKKISRDETKAQMTKSSEIANKLHTSTQSETKAQMTESSEICSNKLHTSTQSETKAQITESIEIAIDKSHTRTPPETKAQMSKSSETPIDKLPTKIQSSGVTETLSSEVKNLSPLHDNCNKVVESILESMIDNIFEASTDLIDINNVQQVVYVPVEPLKKPQQVKDFQHKTTQTFPSSPDPRSTTAQKEPLTVCTQTDFPTEDPSFQNQSLSIGVQTCDLNGPLSVTTVPNNQAQQVQPYDLVSQQDQAVDCQLLKASTVHQFVEAMMITVVTSESQTDGVMGNRTTDKDIQTISGNVCDASTGPDNSTCDLIPAPKTMIAGNVTKCDRSCSPISFSFARNDGHMNYYKTVGVHSDVSTSSNQDHYDKIAGELQHHPTSSTFGAQDSTDNPIQNLGPLSSMCQSSDPSSTCTPKQSPTCRTQESSPSTPSLPVKYNLRSAR